MINSDKPYLVFPCVLLPNERFHKIMGFRHFAAENRKFGDPQNLEFQPQNSSVLSPQWTKVAPGFCCLSYVPRQIPQSPWSLWTREESSGMTLIPWLRQTAHLKKILRLYTIFDGLGNDAGVSRSSTASLNTMEASFKIFVACNL